jgi:deoxyribodipyrimidine photo-lyase
MLPIHSTKDDIVSFIKSFDVVHYSRTRNHLKGGVSYLSPFITRGVITLPEIRAIVLESFTATEAEKFIQELTWREYWQEVWFARCDDIFSDLRYSRHDWVHFDIIQSIINASTTIEAVDDAIATLYETGYMHNHARMWVAMLACNVGMGHWYNHSRWLYYHLLDGDVASNTLSWQWVAGTNAHKKYITHQSVINACSHKKQTHSFLNQVKEEVGEGMIPQSLIATTSFLFKTKYPKSEDYNYNAHSFFLYCPWTLNPDWRRGQEGERILLIEPRWFDRFPVSDKVMDSILTIARIHVPNIKIVVANNSDIHLPNQSKVFSQRHQTHAGWSGIVDKVDRLYPNVTGYYSSFFKFWEICQNDTST